MSKWYVKVKENQTGETIKRVLLPTYGKALLKKIDFKLSYDNSQHKFIIEKRK